MKDLLIAVAILLILVAVFSHYDVRPEGDTALYADGTREQGESEQIESDKGNLPSIHEPIDSPDYTELALKVINGDWGNGYIRKQRLYEAGHDAQAVQEVVNDILKEKETK